MAEKDRVFIQLHVEITRIDRSRSRCVYDSTATHQAIIFYIPLITVHLISVCDILQGAQGVGRQCTCMHEVWCLAFNTNFGSNIPIVQFYGCTLYIRVFCFQRERCDISMWKIVEGRRAVWDQSTQLTYDTGLSRPSMMIVIIIIAPGVRPIQWFQKWSPFAGSPIVKYVLLVAGTTMPQWTSWTNWLTSGRTFVGFNLW